MSNPLLKADNIKIVFGGVTAANEASLVVREGEYLAIIGGNGSGKTTFLNLCTGYVHPTAGDVYFEGRKITRLAPRAITRRGIARAFQLPQLFLDRTVRENLMLSIAAREGVWQGWRPLQREAYRYEAEVLLKLAGLQEVSVQPAAELPQGRRKLTDILMALALKPRLVLLDEPTSGVSTDEKFELMETLMRALHEENVTALFIEHDMEIVRRYADRVAVWDAGKPIMQGPPKEVLSDPEVVKSVIGV
jgi:branched-chain amino acid transport system ATP-binding protein